jgi:hypothetical protein
VGFRGTGVGGRGVGVAGAGVGGFGVGDSVGGRGVGKRCRRHCWRRSWLPRVGDIVDRHVVAGVGGRV